MNSSVFINYRRQDAAAEAGRIASAIKQKLRDVTLFMDSSSLEPGVAWPNGIQQALRNSSIVIVVIGSDWLRAGSDEWGKRRIDQENDWVRQELAFALAAKDKVVIPVLVREAKLPPPDALPESVRELTHRQAIEIRTSYWDHDINLLLRQLIPNAQGVEYTSRNDPYPLNPPEGPDPITDEKLKVFLSTELLKWKKKVSPLPEDPENVRVELYREYRFKSFREAISFMSQVAPGCDIAMHHPRWENVWKTVRVYLTTWDIGHRISDRDIQLARYFDRAFGEYAGAARKSVTESPNQALQQPRPE